MDCVRCVKICTSNGSQEHLIEYAQIHRRVAEREAALALDFTLHKAANACRLRSLNTQNRSSVIAHLPQNERSRSNGAVLLLV